MRTARTLRPLLTMTPQTSGTGISPVSVPCLPFSLIRTCNILTICLFLSLCFAANAAQSTPQGPSGPESGSLAIQAIQGTPGGPGIVNADVTIEFYQRGQIIDTRTATLDAHGVVVLDDIPIAGGVRPLARIKHAGVLYQQPGEVMDSEHPSQKLAVTCYEVTNDEPDWQFNIRQVMVTQGPQGIRVTEVVVVRSSGDRTWLGTIVNDRAQTVALQLPESADDVSLGKGFHNWTTTSLRGKTLVNHLPLMPGPTELDFSYSLVSDGGRAVLDLAAPAAVDHLIVIVPAVLPVSGLLGVTLTGMTTIADTQVQLLETRNVDANERVSLVIGGVQSQPILTRTAPIDTDSAQQTVGPARIIGAIAGGMLVIGAIILLVYFPTLTRKKTRSQEA